MAPADERIDVNTSVAVRGDSGFFFGTLRWFEGDRFLVEVDAALPPGEPVDVRVTLGTSLGTALLRARVLRPLVTARGETPRFVFSTLEVKPEDRQLLDMWLTAVKTKGTFSRFETVVPSQHPSDITRQQTSTDVRSALERLARKPISAAGGLPTDPFGVRSDIATGANPGGGRGAVRDALRGAVARSAAARPGFPPTPPLAAGSLPPRPPPPAPARPPSSGTPSSATPSSATRSSAPVSTAPASTAPASTAPGVNPTRDPTYATTQTRVAQWLEVRWHTRKAFGQACRHQLCNQLLVLARDGEPLPDHEPLRIMLRHGTVQVESAATVKAHGAFGATYKLQLDTLQLEQLNQWAIEHDRR